MNALSWIYVRSDAVGGYSFVALHSRARRLVRNAYRG
jgi:hypothetical protein